MDYKYNEIIKMINNGIEPLLTYVVKKDDVDRLDMKNLDKFFKVVTKLGHHVRQSVVIIFNGYDDIPDELFTIPEVRKFVAKMFKRYPYILYYINKELEGHHWLLSSIADEVEAVFKGDLEVTKMNAFELFEKFGTDTPKMRIGLVFKEDHLIQILAPIIKHGVQINDKQGATEIAIDYALEYSNWDKTLMEMGIYPWENRR